MIVWTLRHPPIDRQGLCIGQTQRACTIPIEDAVAQAMASAPFVPVRIVGSDLPRCARLAEGLADAWGCDLTLNPQLREMSFGEWDGRSYDEIDATDSVRWRNWCDNWFSQAPPGGESTEQFSARIGAWLVDDQPCDRTAVVTHAGVIRVFQVMSGASWDDAMASQHGFLSWTRHAVMPITE